MTSWQFLERFAAVSGSSTFDSARDDAPASGAAAPDTAAPTVPAASALTFDVVSPLDGSLIGRLPQGTPDDIRAAAARARTAQRQWAETGLWARADILAHFAQQVLDHQDTLLDLIHAENGKSRLHALEEVLDVILTAGYFAAQAPRQLKPQRRRGAIPLLTSTRVHYRPKGVVGLIAPWNYPLTLVASDALAALAAGNAVVVKPDSLTPFTALMVAQLLEAAGLPEGLFQVVPGPGRDLGTPLIEAVDHLMFTGSTATGKLVAEQCSAALKSCSAELGGKNPMIVLADADIPRAVDNAMTACFSTSGQLCVSIERIYVDRAVYRPFLDALVERTQALRLGTDAGWDVDLGPLISQQQLDKVAGQVAEAVAQGARVVTGGRTRPDLGPLFHEPTILEGVDATMALYREETFGPVVAVYPVADEDEAVAAANDTEYGLNASVWGRDTAHARAVAARLRAGSVNVNEGYAATFGAVDAPMGGMGVSGLGRRHGPEGLRGFTEPQTISVERLLSLAPPPGVSRQVYATFMTHASRWLYVTPARLGHVLAGLVGSAPTASGGVASSGRAAGGDGSVSSAGAAGRGFRAGSGGGAWPGETARRERKPFFTGFARPSAESAGRAGGSRQAGVPLRGARVLITGGGSGMGRLMALGAAGRGAAVTVWDLNGERAASVAEEIVVGGGLAQSQAIDVTEVAAVNRAAARTGPIDVVIHSAGVVGGRRLVDEPAEAVHRTIDVNLKALFWVTQAFLPGMLERRHGYVVTLASAAGLLAGAKMADYAASKSGAIGFTESLRNELRQDRTGVGALLVAPYYVKTGMFSGVRTRVPWLLPLLEPEAVAEKVLDGVEHGRRLIVLPPFAYSIYLLRLLPIGWLDRIADLFGINASMAEFTGRATDRV